MDSKRVRSVAGYGIVGILDTHVKRPSAFVMRMDIICLPDDKRRCKQCSAYLACCRVKPCNHKSVCAGCSQSIDKCPKCKRPADEIVFLAPRPSTQNGQGAVGGGEEGA